LKYKKTSILRLATLAQVS